MTTLRFAAPGAALLLAAAGLAGPAAAQSRWDEVEVRAAPVAGQVHVVTGAGGNIGVSAGPDGILIVDAQFAPLAPRIRRAIEGILPGPLEFVLNTHWHKDHTDGNRVFGPEAPVIAHRNVRRRLSTRAVVRGEPFEPYPAGALPVITFSESLSVHFNGEEIRLVHLPAGHTDGDGVVWFTGSNVVHMGDLLFAGKFPFIDEESGGSVDGYLANVAAVLERLPPGARVIPGHGEVCGRAELETFLRMLRETSALVAGRRREGMSLEEAQRAGLPGTWDSWDGGFISRDAWIATLYRASSS